MSIVPRSGSSLSTIWMADCMLSAENSTCFGSCLSSRFISRLSAFISCRASVLFTRSVSRFVSCLLPCISDLRSSSRLRDCLCWPSAPCFWGCLCPAQSFAPSLCPPAVRCVRLLFHCLFCEGFCFVEFKPKGNFRGEFSRSPVCESRRGVRLARLALFADEAVI